MLQERLKPQRPGPYLEYPEREQWLVGGGLNIVEDKNLENIELAIPVECIKRYRNIDDGILKFEPIVFLDYIWRLE